MFAFLLFTANKSNSSIQFLGESLARQSDFQFFLTFKRKLRSYCPIITIYTGIETFFQASARSTPVHLSSATRERLWARSTGQTTTTASSSGTSGGPTTSIGHNGQFEEIYKSLNIFLSLFKKRKTVKTSPYFV